MRYRHFLLFAVLVPFLATIGVAQEPRASVQKMTLDGAWGFRDADSARWFQASVPGCVHTDLMKNNLIPDPFFGTNEAKVQWIGERDWVYQRTFDLPPALLRHDSVEIVFKGLDTYASVRLNDSLLLTADNMFREWRKSCKTLLREKGNTLTILFHNVFGVNLPKQKSAPFPLQAYGNNDQADVKIAMYSRKAQFHYGWDWGPRLITCGVWRPVVVEAWNAVRIAGTRIVQEKVDRTSAEITTFVDVCSGAKQWVRVVVTADSAVLAAKDTMIQPGLNRIAVAGTIARPNLWWTNGLGTQYLYRFRASVTTRSGLQDVASNNVGIRSLEVVRDHDSLGTSLFIRLNGVPVFMKGADYIPQDNFQNRVTPERCEFMVRSAAEAHMNMLRVWGGGIYEDDQFYDLCDRYGILLWHDLMFACAMYPADDRFLETVRAEIIDNVARIRNHSCLALYCGNNENDAGWYSWGWKKLYSPEVQKEYEGNLHRLFGEVIPAALREADPTRYYHPSSPTAGSLGVSPMAGDLHYWGVWHGKEPFESYENNIARFVSEYGFQSYPLAPSVDRFTEPADRELHSPVMLSHQRCMSDERKDKEYGNRLIATYMDRMLHPPKDFASYLYASQVVQAEGVKMAIEAHRRSMPTCMGSLYWQIDDCWPVASWSSIDYYGEWKALHYYAKRLYVPVAIMPHIVGDRIDLAIVSDRLEAIGGKLTVRLLDLEGKEVNISTVPVTIAANTSAIYTTLTKEAFLRGRDDRQLLLFSTLVAGDSVLAENVTYFRTPKEMLLQKPEITMEVTEKGSGYEIALRTNTVARDVYLSADGLPGFFSDNFFDLVPGTAKKIVFTCGKEVQDLRGKLRVLNVFEATEN